MSMLMCNQSDEPCCLMAGDSQRQGFKREKKKELGKLLLEELQKPDWVSAFSPPYCGFASLKLLA